MKRNVTTGLGFFAAAIAALTIGTTAWADGPARKRPLSDFLDAQGTTPAVIAPFKDFFSWAAPPQGVKTPAPFSEYVGGNMASCDYAGLMNDWLIDNGGPDLGTSFKGSVTERSLGDGRILVNVELHTTNAFVVGKRIVTGNFAVDPLLFGAMAEAVNAGATPGIGECHVSFAWKQSPGPLVDVLAAFFYGAPGFEIINLSFRANASGLLTALAGYGPDGTPGRLFIVQTGFARTTFMGATADAFPAEIVEIRGTGN